jgi:hypothetical protein
MRKEYDFTIEKLKMGDKPYIELRDGYYNRGYTIHEIQSLYYACHSILKKEGYLNNGEKE